MNRLVKNIGIYLMIFVVVLGMAWIYQSGSKNPTEQTTFSDVMKYLEQEKIENINLTDKTITAKLRDGKEIKAFLPSQVDWAFISTEYVLPQVEEGIIKEYTSDPPKKTPWYVSVLPTVIMVLVLVFFWLMILNQGGGGGKVMSFGKSRAKMLKDGEMPTTTFADVAGLYEEKEELEEIVDFLKNPAKYKNLGARMPKGILLYGPPGTGKTYISKATAGEAKVPFFSISGSDFVEMFVGVGASRVRDMFGEAKKNSPCIIFIDEIDAVGRRRGAGLGGGHDEREQTLNQLLVEMDGFSDNQGIIILAATNRPDILDPALLRPGRFDRQIVIGLPDIRGREEIFKVHAKNKPLDEEIKPEVVAKRTPGFSPADIENMLNEATLLTARREGTSVKMEEIEEAITKVIVGPQKKSRIITDDEKKLTAYHEAGHAIISRAIPDSDPVHQVTIIPRGRAGGFTMTLPREEKYYGTKMEMKNDIIGLLGGRVAEMLKLDDVSTGASNDIMRATEIAREMVTKYGFSERLGPVNYSSGDEVFLGRDFSTRRDYSEQTAAEIDSEVKTIMNDCYVAAEKILKDNMSSLEAVAEALLVVETLEADQFEKLYTGEMTAEELISYVEENNEKKQQDFAREAEETRRAMNAEAEKIFMDDEVESVKTWDEIEAEYLDETVADTEKKSE